MARLFIVMGVCGSGKSTIAEQLAGALGAIYLDADDYHPEENVAKMSRGEALDDSDRWPWLKRFGQAMADRDGQVIGACSALRRVYRERINEAADETVCTVYLNGSRELIGRRMAAREGHFMPDSLIDSQFATLEIPDAAEQAIHVDISGTPEQIVTAIIQQLNQ